MASPKARTPTRGRADEPRRSSGGQGCRPRSRRRPEADVTPAASTVAKSYWSAGRPDEAGAIAERLIAHLPDNPVAEAREHVDEAVRIAEASGRSSWAVDALVGWAYGLSTLGDRSAAVEAMLDRVFGMGRMGHLSTDGWVDANAVVTAALAGNAARAQGLLAEYEEIFPPAARTAERRDGHAVMEWGVGYATGDWNRSLDAMDRVQDHLACQVRHWRGWWERGRALEAAGRLEEAKEAYQRSTHDIAMSETRWLPLYLPDALERLARVSEQVGDTAAARDASRRLVELWSEADAELGPRRQAAEAKIGR